MELRLLTVKSPPWRAVFFWIFSTIVFKAAQSRFAAVFWSGSTAERVSPLERFYERLRRFESGCRCGVDRGVQGL